MIPPWMNMLFFWTAVIIYHELGHLLAFGFYGKKVGFRLSLSGILCGSDKDVYSLPVWKLYNVVLAGPFLGILPFLLSNRSNLEAIVYIMICSQDLITLVYLASKLGKSYAKKRDWMLIDIQMEDLVKIKNDIYEDMLKDFFGVKKR